jgi:hypothetical protein
MVHPMAACPLTSLTAAVAQETFAMMDELEDEKARIEASLVYEPEYDAWVRLVEEIEQCEERVKYILERLDAAGRRAWARRTQS